jgi:putative transcriptional regulator
MKAAKQILKATAAKGAPQRGYLDGQMLIAMPSMRDERFARTLIYICAHSSEGAMGIVVNQPAANINFADLLVQLEVIQDTDLIQLPRRAGAVQVLKGGPVEPGRGFVLLHRELDAAHRRRHLPHRHPRCPQGDRQGRRP